MLLAKNNDLWYNPEQGKPHQMGDEANVLAHRAERLNRRLEKLNKQSAMIDDLRAEIMADIKSIELELKALAYQDDKPDGSSKAA